MERIRVVPSSNAGRPDFVADIRQPDNTLVSQRLEVTTVTGASPGYQPRRKGGADTPMVSTVSAAIKNTVGTTSVRASQFDTPMEGVPARGTLAPHLRGVAGESADDIASKSMERAPESLRNNPAVDRVEFFVPGNGVLVYTKMPDGFFQLRP